MQQSMITNISGQNCLCDGCKACVLKHVCKCGGVRNGVLSLTSRSWHVMKRHDTSSPHLHKANLAGGWPDAVSKPAGDSRNIAWPSAHHGLPSWRWEHPQAGPNAVAACSDMSVMLDTLEMLWIVFNMLSVGQCRLLNNRCTCSV